MFIEGTNYILLTGVCVTTGMLKITASFFLPGGDNDLVGLAGLQVVLVAVPEPASLLLLAAALVSIGRRCAIRR